MTTNSMTLVGCTPTPLANYLKALGVLRLLTSPLNNVNETAADPQARGWWENEYFRLRTRLDRESLMRFFLEDYAPSPIIAPWNGGSGFYPKDNKDGIALLMAAEVAKRFRRMASTIQMASDEIKNRSLTSSPKGNEKVEFVARLRSCLPEFALDWLDATLSLSGDRLNFPQLLGTGGNDGRLDFTNNFMQRLVSTGRPSGLFDAVTGSPQPHAEPFLRTSLFADIAPSLQSFAIGQFAPGLAGGPNASTGYEASSNVVNPWDFVLALEGAVIFAGTAARRHQGSPESGASFPFTVRPVGAGWGGVADTDEGSARAEFWAPLWNQPATCGELEGLLKEGRAVLNGKTARDGLDFARAAASLGVSRGVNAFERYGFVMRAGKAYLAAPLGTRKVESNASDAAVLISDLDTGGWLGRVRRLARGGNVPARARAAAKQLEDALFAMSEASVSRRSVQGALCALGGLVQWLVSSQDEIENISPPPRLSSRWVCMADDGTPEYRLAAALASLGWRSGRHAGASDGAAKAERPERIAMAAHFAPLDPVTILQERRSWKPQNGRRVVWNAGDLISNLIAVLERRLIDAEIDDPLDAAMPAQLADVAAFLDQDFDEGRCGRLLAGLVWARPAWPFARQHSRPVVPFAYAALKPIFASDTDLKALEEAKLIPPKCRIPVPPGLVSRLRSGRMDEAVGLALDRARASGIACPFAHPGIAKETKTSRRLAAALLIPLDEYGLKTLMQRAYPAEAEKESQHVA